MLIYIISFSMIMIFGALIYPKKNLQRRKYFVFLAFGNITLVAMLRKYTVGIDLTKYYYNSFLRFLSWDWKDVIVNPYEAGYYYFNIVIGKLTSNPQMFIAIHAIIVFAIYGWFIYKNSDDVIFSTFLVIAMNDWFMYMNIMRQALAIAIVLVASQLLKKEELGKKRYIGFIFLILLASTFHNSALLMLVLIPIYLLEFRRKEIVLSSCLILGLSLIYDRLFILVASFLNHRDYIDAYLNKGNQDTGLLSIYQIFIFAVVFIFGCYYLIIRYSKTQKIQSLMPSKQLYFFEDSFLMYCVLAALLCRVFSLNLTIMGRVAYYFYPFVWIAIPRVFRKIPNVRTRFLFKICFVSLIFTMFLCTTYTSAGYLFGTVPYEFFWAQ